MRDIDHFLPSNAEVTNEWSYICTPHICLQGMERAWIIFKRVKFFSDAHFDTRRLNVFFFLN